MNTVEAQNYVYALSQLQKEQFRLIQKRCEYDKVYRNLINSKKALKYAHRMHWNNQELRTDKDFINLIVKLEVIYMQQKMDFRAISTSIKLQKSIVNDRQKLVSFYCTGDA